MERFAIIVITKSSTLDIAAVLDPPLERTQWQWQGRARNKKISYKTWDNSKFEIWNIKTVCDGSKITSYVNPKIWKHIPENNIGSKNANIFKSKIISMCLYRIFLWSFYLYSFTFHLHFKFCIWLITDVHCANEKEN